MIQYIYCSCVFDRYRTYYVKIKYLIDE